MSAIAVELSDLDIKVADLIARLKRDQEIIITDSHQPVAKLTAINEPVVAETAVPSRRQGGQSESITWISPDFDEPLEDFKEYMP